MTTDKPVAHLLAEEVALNGIRYAVISPGSRSAPLVIAFNAQKKIKCLVVVDERSAAFFALGIAQQTGVTAALICTSGSAILNYAPAIAEAYYQKVPLLVITADRPPELIDKGDGQTIRQDNIYSNYCNYFFNLPLDSDKKSNNAHLKEEIISAINCTKCPEDGPVHINIPFKEPLYGTVEFYKYNRNEKPIINSGNKTGAISAQNLEKYKKEWVKAKKIMIVCGLHKPDKELNRILNILTENKAVAILTETTSNLQNKKFICNIDSLLNRISGENEKKFTPELLITIGEPVTSKKIKMFLRKNKPGTHWHISGSLNVPDTYFTSPVIINASENSFFSSFIDADRIKVKNAVEGYGDNLRDISEKAIKYLDSYGEQIPFSDLKAMKIILENIPVHSDVHLGNSSPVRYANLFKTDFKKDIHYYSNRGVSGIDGTVSTAAGSAFVSGRITTLIVGDLGFFYDSNALWNKYLTSNLRIIVINNSGGGIFRLIDGPGDSPLLEEYFETKHSMKAETLVKAYNFPCFSAANEKELKQALRTFYNNHKNKPAVLEVFTPNKINPETWKGYFDTLKNIEA